MQRVLQQFVEFTQQLREGLEQSDNYLNKYSQENNVYAEIEQEEKELQVLIANLKVEAALTEIVEAQKREPIPNHYLLPSTQMREMALPHKQDTDSWVPFLQPHHALTLNVRIVRVLPFSRFHEQPKPLPNLKFHLHLFDTHTYSPFLICHPKLSRKEDFYQGRPIRSDNSVNLKVVLKLRQGNCALYSELVRRGESAVLIAQSQKGEVVGKTVIGLDHTLPKEREEFRCLTLGMDSLEDGLPDGTVGNNTLLLETYCKVEYQVIAPPLEELQQNLKEQIKIRKNSKSPSPNRFVSLTPPRNGSPKKKKEGIPAESITQPISITIFEQWEYKHSLGTVAPISKELTYKQLTNLIERKVQLVRVGQQYFLKCWARREGEGHGQLLFQFGNKDYSLTVIPNHQHQIVQYDHYTQLQREKRLLSPNKLLRLPGGTLIYPSSRIRIIKNHAKQAFTEGLLGSLFLKSPFQDCQIYVLPPFELAGVVNKQQGYIIHIYCDNHQTTTATLLLHSKGQLQQIHMFDCLIERRSGSKQTLYRRASVPHGETMCEIDLGNIVNESYEYWMRSCDPKIHLINAHQYRTTYGPLRLQLSTPLTEPLITELLIYDSKYRSFSLEILLTPTLISNQQ